MFIASPQEDMLGSPFFANALDEIIIHVNLEIMLLKSISVSGHSRIIVISGCNGFSKPKSWCNSETLFKWKISLIRIQSCC